MKKEFLLLWASAGCLWLCGTPALHAVKNAASMAGLAHAARVPLAATAQAERMALTAPAPLDDVPAAQTAFVQQCQRDGLAVRWQAAAKAYELVARDAAYMSAWRASCDALRQALPQPAARVAARHVPLKSGALALDAPAGSTTPGWYFVAADSARDLAALHVEDYVGNGTWLVRLSATSDLARIRAWLTQHGFKIDEVPAGNQLIVFSGTAGALNASTKRHQRPRPHPCHGRPAALSQTRSALARSGRLHARR
ncbi:MAG: hypothetical protein NTV22_04295 [bacterium]|nr:hypothetical protein [bacterium]